MSRNTFHATIIARTLVAPREGRVSRNILGIRNKWLKIVAPREGRVSRNTIRHIQEVEHIGRAPRGACE